MPHPSPQSSESTKSRPPGDEGGTEQTRVTARLDRWAIFLSSVCVIHCLAIPITLVLTPVLAQDLINHQSSVHWLLLGLAVPLSAIALWVGFKRHGYWPCLGAGVVGLLLMSLGVSHIAGETAELPLSVLGALCLAYAHVENMRRHQHR